MTTLWLASQGDNARLEAETMVNSVSVFWLAVVVFGVFWRVIHMCLSLSGLWPDTFAYSESNCPSMNLCARAMIWLCDCAFLPLFSSYWLFTCPSSISHSS